MSDDRIDVVFGAKIADLLAGVSHAQRATKESVESMKSSMESLKGTVEGVQNAFRAFAAILVGGELFKEIVERTAAAGEHLEVLSQKTGMAADQLSRLEYAAQLSDVPVEALGMGFVRLARGMEEAQRGAGPAAEAFERLGVRALGTHGQLRPMHDVLLDIADRFRTMENGAGKTALALDLFGRQGAALIPLLNEGREGVARFEAEADRLGVTMGQDDVEAATAYEDAMKRFHATMGALERRIALEVMPALTEIAAGMTSLASTTGRADTAMHPFGETLKFLAKAGLEGYVALNAFAQSAAFLTLLLTTPVNAQFAETVTAAWHKMGEEVTEVNGKVADAINKINGFGGARTKKPQEKAGGGGGGGDASGMSALERMQLEWLKIAEQEQEHFGELAAMELAFWQRKLATVRAGSKEYLEIRRRIVALEQQEAKTSYEGELAALRAKEELDKDRLVDVLEDRKAELEIIRKHYKEASKEVQDGIARVNEVQARMRKESAKEWEETFNAIPKAFSKAAGGIGKEIFSLRDLFRTFFKDLVVMGVQAGAASVRNWAATELAKKNLTLSSVAARVAAETWGAIQSVALGAWAALKNIANYAAQAIAAAWAAISAIPVVGPFMAPAVAAGAGAMVLGLSGRVMSAAGGYDVPAGINPMTQLHAQEMVLPASIANKIRASMGEGSDGSAGRPVHLHVHTPDAEGVRRLFLNNSEAVAAAVAKAIDHNNGPLNRALRNRG